MLQDMTRRKIFMSSSRKDLSDISLHPCKISGNIKDIYMNMVDGFQYHVFLKRISLDA